MKGAAYVFQIELEVLNLLGESEPFPFSKPQFPHELSLDNSDTRPPREVITEVAKGNSKDEGKQPVHLGNNTTLNIFPF